MAPTKPRGLTAESPAREPARGLATPLQYVKGIGPHRAKLLAKLGLQTVEDALFYLRTRGIDAEAARRLLTYVFANEVLEQIKVESLRVRLEGWVGTQLYRGNEREGAS